MCFKQQLVNLKIQQLVKGKCFLWFFDCYYVK